MFKNRGYLRLLNSLMNVAYLLTGGNVGNPKVALERAKEDISRHCGEIVAVSALYQTEAWGNENQEPFLNQCLKIRTLLKAAALLYCILSIEQNGGRIRDKKYGPRIIDIDILLFNNDIIKQPGLAVPHPQLHNRRFALQCLNEVAATEVHPVFDKTISQLLAECSDPLGVLKLSGD